MFAQLVYTRCGQGLDILKGGRPISTDGYKVFSCSGEILNGGFADLPFLDSVARGKQSFDDPTFMDDAYLYFTPDKGETLMLNFHPIPFVQDAQGNYSHRSGNFINQVFAGSFQNFYPYELFGSPCAWDAKGKGEAYYYSSPSAPLPLRDNIDDSAGSVLQDDISAFINDGRKETFAAAVAFLLAQFALPPESRKYLIIQDENSSKIELWIAAIESAFSPRMASGLSFATRLDKFTRTNMYTVNAQGNYQPLIDLQDPNQKLRYMAMIVGVDNRDSSNRGSVRQVAASPFAVVNGEAKTFSGDGAPSHPYYSAIASFDEDHCTFCREFLQMLDIKAPCADILNLYTSFSVLNRISEASEIKKVAASFAAIEKYGFVPNNYLSKLYRTTKNMLPNFMSRNFSYAFTVLAWLRKVAPLVGDMEAAEAFNRIVCEAFFKDLFSAPQSGKTTEFWTGIQKSAFFDVVAKELTDQACIDTHQEYINGFSCESWVAFLRIFLLCAQKSPDCSQARLLSVLNGGLRECYQQKNGKAARQIYELLGQYKGKAAGSFLLKMALGSDESYSAFLMRLLLIYSPELTESAEAVFAFCKELQAKGLGQLCGAALQYKAEQLKSSSEIEKFLNSVKGERSLREYDLSGMYVALDSNIDISESGISRLSAKLQQSKPEACSCKNSAHVCAFTVFDDRKKRSSLMTELQEYVRQGFPSVENSAFAEKLSEKILAGGYDRNNLSFIFEMFSGSDFYLSALIGEILRHTSQKQNLEWNMLLNMIVTQKSTPLSNILIAECVKLKQPERQIAQLEKLISDQSSLRFFQRIAARVIEKSRENNPPSIIAKMFGFKSDDPRKPRK